MLNKVEVGKLYYIYNDTTNVMFVCDIESYNDGYYKGVSYYFLENPQAIYHENMKWCQKYWKALNETNKTN